jgi:lipopolysaccharide export system protein LptA
MRRLLHALIVPMALAIAAPLAAQDRAVAFGQSLRLSGSELEIDSDSLEVDQASGATVFTGNVRAEQGGLSIETQSLRLEYEPGASAGTRRIGRLVASGGVVMATQTEAIEAREAIYSLSSQTLEMTGDVVLVQGPSVLAGQRFVADLRAGTGRMIGRVRTVIQLD